VSEFHAFESGALIMLFVTPLVQTSPTRSGTRLAPAGHHDIAERVWPPREEAMPSGLVFPGQG